MKELLDEVSRVIDNVTHWLPLTTPGDSRGFTGSVDGWVFTVVEFHIQIRDPLAYEGYGYDGACSNGARGIVLHLTPELAKKAFQAALPKEP